MAWAASAEVVLSANVHNYLSSAKDAEVSLELEGGVLEIVGSAVQRVNIAAGGETRVDWRVRVVGSGEAIVRMKALTDEESDLGNPSFMTVHALNLIDPNNWPEVTSQRADGSQETFRQYVSPEAEDRHFRALRDESRERRADGDMQAALSVALDPARSTPALARAAVEWAQKSPEGPPTQDTDDS